MFYQEENDDNYEEEQEIADEFDSDFDEDVSNCAVILRFLHVFCVLILQFLYLWSNLI